MAMKNGKLGVCVIGCGDLGSKHAERWQNLPNAQVVAVCDILPDRGQKAANLYGLSRWYDDYREAVVLPEVDVVSVCVPTYLHPRVTIAAAEAGKHVLSEKPIALTLEEADSMIEAAERCHVKLSVGFMRRYSPTTHALRKWLGEGNLGRPLMYRSLDARELRPKREMHDPHANGGPLIDMCVHLFDGWSYIFDSRPVSVYALGMKFAAGRPEVAHIPDPAFDTASVEVKYESGDVGVFTVTWGLAKGVNPQELPDEIYGPKGALKVFFEMRHQGATAQLGKEEFTEVSDSTLDMYQVEIETFARCILEDLPLPVSGKNGKDALRVSLAALESIRTGQVISLA
jgi:predicted dehydrogenase